MKKQLLSLCAVVLLAHGATVQAQAGIGFPILRIDMSAVRYLEKAEQLYEQGNYKRAYFIYRHELAPVGDKYAQYMVGYMSLTGQGTEPDRVAAAAWYRLAAERGTEEFTQVHNQLLVSLTPDQIDEYDRQFVSLRKQYGDLPILMQAVREDFERLRTRTGSRVGSSASPVVVIDMRRGGMMGSADVYYEEIEGRLQTRLQMIAWYLEIDGADIDVKTINLDELEDRIDAYLESPN